MDLSGRVAFVPGGGGLSLGAAIVDRLASQGATVAVVDLEKEGADRVAAEAHERWGVRVLPIRCDVTVWEDVTDAMAMCVRELGALDILVNNVGGVETSGGFETNSMDWIETLTRRVLLSHMACCRTALDYMIARGAGAIVNISSDGGKRGIPGITVYDACKAGVIGFTRNLALDVSKYGIRVNSVCPGIMLTSMMAEALADLPADDPMVAPIEFAIDRVPLDRGCLPEEVANAVAFLASDAASYIQGAAISVGGGLDL
jgi:3-oxoacyl-[acyl-carrier protein] reductase